MEIWDGVEQIALATSISNIVEDTTPQLGGDLDCQSYIIQGDVENNLNTQRFGGNILGLMTDPKLLNVMCEDPAGGASSYKDISGNEHHGTPTGTWTSGDRLKQGKSWVLDPNGTDAYIDFGDDDDFSFGDGAADSPFTIFGLIEVVNNNRDRVFFSKEDLTTGSELREYRFYLTSLEQCKVLLIDESANVNVDRKSDLAISFGFHFIVITYDGGGGATAADGIKIYVDGLLVNSTATNNGAYVAMENTSTSLLQGVYLDASGDPEAFLDGDFGLMGIEAVEMSATDIWRMWQYVLAAYSENGTTL